MSLTAAGWSRHYSTSALIPASPEHVFEYIDDHRQFSSHMGETSWMMAGSAMCTDIDEAGGRSVGSHIRMDGHVLGLHVSLDEVITERHPPVRKVWETVGEPALVVIGSYRMGVGLRAESSSTALTVFIDYNMPRRGAILGALLGAPYARWCVNQMLHGVVHRFASP